MVKYSTDKEIQQYRDLVAAPEEFEDGFGWKMVLGTLFMGLLMVPASIYLSLFIGESMGPAAKWVTVILFAEVAKRSMKTLRQQEIYLLFYMVGLVLIHPMRLPVWVQYLRQSPAAEGLGVAPEIPTWVAPTAPMIEQSGRTFFTSEWAVPLFVLAFTIIIERLDSFGMGYALYRMTAHIERLPFPMAPIGALSITALADDRDPANAWRWKMFSLGGLLGLAFGFIYIGVPALTNSLFGSTIEILPIPWLDLNPSIATKDFLPAVPINIVFDMGMFILGMVLPFWAVVGGFIGLILTWIINPFLYDAGILTSWEPGMSVVDTLYNNTVDFFLSFNIGLALAIFVASLAPILWSLLKQRRESQEEAAAGRDQRQRLVDRDPKRGDLSFLTAILIYLASVVLYIVFCLWLMPGDEEGRGRFPWMFFLGFALIYQPIYGYVNAKLEGMVGQTVPIPLVREAAFILSGYKGAGIWFAPIPMSNHAHVVRQFRVMELTGTKVSGVIKTELLAVPIVIITMIVFSELIWRLAPIPSDAYPFTQEVWDLQARNFSLMATATLEGSSEFMNALKTEYILWGFGLGVVSFAVLSWLSLPTFLVYGAVRGLNQTQPGAIWIELCGAIVGRLYLERRLGSQKYKQYMSVIFAGFSAGVGLIGMIAVSVAWIITSTTTLGY